MPLPPRKCVHCEQYFPRTHSRQKYCSADCKHGAMQELVQKRMLEQAHGGALSTTGTPVRRITRVQARLRRLKKLSFQAIETELKNGNGRLGVAFLQAIGELSATSTGVDPAEDAVMRAALESLKR